MRVYVVRCSIEAREYMPALKKLSFWIKEIFMKRKTKLIALFLCTAMILGLSATAFASE